MLVKLHWECVHSSIAHTSGHLSPTSNFQFYCSIFLRWTSALSAFQPDWFLLDEASGICQQISPEISLASKQKKATVVWWHGRDVRYVPVGNDTLQEALQKHWEIRDSYPFHIQVSCSLCQTSHQHCCGWFSKWVLSSYHISCTVLLLERQRYWAE